MSCAPSPSSDFLPLCAPPPLVFSLVAHNSSDGKPTASLILGRSSFCQEQTDCISSPFSYLGTLRFPLSLFFFSPLHFRQHLHFPTNFTFGCICLTRNRTISSLFFCLSTRSLKNISVIRREWQCCSNCWCCSFVSQFRTQSMQSDRKGQSRF